MPGEKRTHVNPLVKVVRRSLKGLLGERERKRRWYNFAINVLTNNGKKLGGRFSASPTLRRLLTEEFLHIKMKFSIYLDLDLM